MEKRPRGFEFFFANSIERIDTLLRFSRSKFSHLFGGGARTELNSPERSFKALIAEGHDSKYVEMVWLAGDDPMKIEHMERMPIIDYWHLLNRKYAAAEKLAVQMAKVRAGKR